MRRVAILLGVTAGNGGVSRLRGGREERSHSLMATVVEDFPDNTTHLGPRVCHPRVALHQAPPGACTSAGWLRPDRAVSLWIWASCAEFCPICLG